MNKLNGFLYHWLIFVLYKHDLMFLRKFGIPYEEYRAEAKTIMPLIKNQTKEEIQKILYDVFYKSFNGHGPNLKDCDAASQEIADFMSGKDFVVNISDLI